jgi:hypothetical protein
MFDTLADRMRQDELELHGKQRVVRWLAVVVIALVLFGGLYLAVQVLES